MNQVEVATAFSLIGFLAIMVGCSIGSERDTMPKVFQTFGMGMLAVSLFVGLKPFMEAYL